MATSGRIAPAENETADAQAAWSGRSRRWSASPQFVTSMGRESPALRQGDRDLECEVGRFSKQGHWRHRFGYVGPVPHEGQDIVNPRTGQRMRFVAIRDGELRIKSLNPPTDQREPEHVHPKQESGAEVRSGSLVFEVEGQERRVGPGESITIPPNTPHRFWNGSEGETESVQFFRPALDIAAFFETYFELGRRGELTEAGDIPLLQVATMVPEFGHEIRLTRPPWPVVRAISALLGPVARLRGYRGRLEYGSEPPRR
jgi:quercetin dioxygenase-like cupin family protein